MCLLGVKKMLLDSKCIKENREEYQKFCKKQNNNNTNRNCGFKVNLVGDIISVAGFSFFLIAYLLFSCYTF